MFSSEMKRLAIMAEISAGHGHAVRQSKTEGNSGDVKFGLDAGGAYIELWGRRISDDDAKTLVADLLNGLSGAGYMAWSQEHFRREVPDAPR